VKARFAAWRADSPWRDGLVYYSSGGHSEWFAGSIGGELMRFASSFDETDLVVQTLRTALAIVDAEPAAQGGPLVLRGPGA
jgi:hypothetical protein